MSAIDIRIGQLGIHYLLDGSHGAGLGLFELEVPPASNVPPPHSHAGSEELVYVLAGRLRYTVGAETRDLDAGQVMHTPRGVVHAFANPFDTTARALIMMSPDVGAGYFQEVAEIVNRAGPPDRVALAAVMGRHGLVPAARADA